MQRPFPQNTLRSVCGSDVSCVPRCSSSRAEVQPIKVGGAGEVPWGCARPAVPGPPWWNQVLLMFAVAAAELVPLHGGADRACKGMTNGDTKQVEKWSADSLEQCKQICSGKCQAIQWVESTHLCELWNVPVVHTMAEQGAQCYANSADATQISALMPKDTMCLSSTSTCSSADARVACLMSKDSSGPCVWFPASRGDTRCLDTVKCSEVRDKLICLSSKAQRAIHRRGQCNG
eukprot:Skav210664  [mRNA]  locus=scaffold697:66360:77195:+ [translate_table: standard]